MTAATRFGCPACAEENGGWRCTREPGCIVADEIAASDHRCEPDCPVCANRAEIKRLGKDMKFAAMNVSPSGGTPNETSPSVAARNHERRNPMIRLYTRRCRGLLCKDTLDRGLTP